MAHISSYMADTTSSAGLDSLTARDLSALPSSPDTRLQPPATEKREKHIWRMHQPSEAPRKYSIFPSKEKLPVSTGRQSPNIEYASTSSTGEKPNSQKTRQLNRRRKSSITESGTMTTVNEAGMDSRKCSVISEDAYN
ncbi:hypothetical protein DSL72_000347 [Monilinia vaccinii-corymbosi]|uniref:Uncharacterized protein n=1 Tax=Monilinia vaccinii-corymbosi TaxID=61207 RepID=A0A8A3P9H9_9HELO|nr:hypothetical protein DSL72_000347 [Monilinia vaccinii-corymbosi]